MAARITTFYVFSSVFDLRHSRLHIENLKIRYGWGILNIEINHNFSSIAARITSIQYLICDNLDNLLQIYISNMESSRHLESSKC